MNRVVRNRFRLSVIAGLFATALVGCGSDSGGGNSGNKPDTLPPGSDWPQPNLAQSHWGFDGGSAGNVVSAKLAGSYAVADPSTLNIELRDIEQNLKHQISFTDIAELLPDMDLSHDSALCGMTYTPSGRFLYLAICGSGSSDDAILAFNTNTESLTLFHRLKLRGEDSRQRLGMNYFSSNLYVGADSGVYRLEADKNAAFEVENLGRELKVEKININGPVESIAVDVADKKLYLQTPSRIYRMSHTSNSPQVIHQDEGLTGIDFSRVYGDEESAGLYISMTHESGTGLLFAPIDEARKQSSLSPTPYLYSPQPWADFSLTAEGRLLVAKDGASMFQDRDDTRLSYHEWLRDELKQYVTAIKGLTASNMSGNFASPEGFLHRKLEHSKPNTTPIADNVGWALYLLMIADQIEHDPEIESYVELLIQRHAGLHRDGKGGERSIDGHFVRNYNTDGSINSSNPQYQVYISMKFLPAAIKAAEMYPNNTEIVQYAKYLRQLFKRSGDVVRAEQRITWDSDDFGPVRLNRLMSNETWLYGDLAAAQDPIATRNYGKFTYDRESFLYDDELLDQPVIKSSHSAFIIMGGPLILEHHYSDKAWAEQNHNYYALTQAETDEIGLAYFGGFSAGHSPNSNGNYYNDGPTDHPDDFIHFPAVKGFGQLGKSDALVGAYMAYRDGRRNTMISAGSEQANLLTRWSHRMPDYDKMSVGIADFWYGAVGLAETIQPGVTQKFRNTFYRPDTQIEMNEQGVDEVYFSALTPRLITGVRLDGSRAEFGYHRSPFTVPNQDLFVSYEVEDPTGEWVELDDLVGIHNVTAPIEERVVRFKNPNFEHEKLGWTKLSGTADAGGSIHGGGVTLQHSAGITQAVYLPTSKQGSKYIVSTYIEPQGSPGKGKVRLSWSSTGDIADADVSTQVTSGNVFGDWENRVISLETLQPANASYLHIEYLTEGSGAFVFGNTALQAFGAKQEFENGDFEQGSALWNLSGDVGITTDRNEVIRGNQSLKFISNSTNWSSAERSIDISNDPVGTRYLFRFRIGKRQLDSSKFEIKFDIENPQSPPNANPTGDWRDVGFIDDTSPENMVVTVRKRPGETALNLVFRVKQESADHGNSNYVIIDDVEVYQQNLLFEDYCNHGFSCQ